MKSLKISDPTIYDLIKQEEIRQKEVLEMIPSENYVSLAVMEALGSVLTNKYSEGYAKKRYYQGNDVIDEVEILAVARAKKLFNVPYVNVQPYSGSPANTAVFFALLEPLKDKIMGLTLASGGHLTHGAHVSFSGKFFQSVPYALSDKGILDYDEIEKIALKEKPKIIIAGFTAYPRIIDFKRFGEIAEKAGAYLLADISHISGLVVGETHPSPVPYAHIVMTTTHKTLRGPRGAMIMVTEAGLKKNPDLDKLIDKAVFPGLQGGPHDNQTAAIAVALGEAQKSSFKKYAYQIIANAKVLAGELTNLGFNLVSGGTDNHLLLVDLRNKKINGSVAAYGLEQANIVLNKNSVPGDTNPPFYPSGIRLGTPALTSRGMKEKEMKKVAGYINNVINELQNSGCTGLPDNKEERSKFLKTTFAKIDKNKSILKVRREVIDLCSRFKVEF